MKTTLVTPDDLRGSVIAVPPLARGQDARFAPEANRRIVSHLERRGVTSLMYGGNANVFHMDAKLYRSMLDLLPEMAAADSWVLPSVGPDFGKAIDQVSEVRRRGYPTLMLLPSSAPTTPAGVVEGVRRLSDIFSGPVVLYIKADGYVDANDLARLQEEGRIAAVKYAVVRAYPAEDAYLDALVATCGTERLVSGIGERPVVEHWRKFGLRAFTSGSVCVAPAGSEAIRAALIAERWEEAERLRALYMPLEDLRDAHSPILVLHAAVEAAGVAPTGPIGPYLSTLDDPATLAAIRSAASSLLGSAGDSPEGGSGSLTPTDRMAPASR